MAKAKKKAVRIPKRNRSGFPGPRHASIRPWLDAWMIRPGEEGGTEPRVGIYGFDGPEIILYSADECRKLIAFLEEAAVFMDAYYTTFWKPSKKDR